MFDFPDYAFDYTNVQMKMRLQNMISLHIPYRLHIFQQMCIEEKYCTTEDLVSKYER